MTLRNSPLLSRRMMLRGAAVALTLPWFESLRPRSVQAAPNTLPKRFMPIFLPNGSADFWRPASEGSGAAWKLSPILEPFAKVKSKMTVITNLENGSAFNQNGSSSVEPSHGRQPGAWLTCIDPGIVRNRLGVSEANGISVDQVMAKHAAFLSKTALPSLQIGLSTVQSNCDGQPCSNSRSISWSGETQPMYKSVDPLEVFNKIAGVATPNDPTGGTDPEAQKRVARRKSVLDAVLENAGRTRARLGSNDQKRMDEFLESVRAVEKRVTAISSGMGGLACKLSDKPTIATVHPDSPRRNTETYNKGDHADIMNDLIVMAFQCDATRIVTYMLEDERSEFLYDHVQRRDFSATGSTPASGTCPEYHNGGQHGSQDDFATITWWNATKVAALCEKLDAIEDAPGVSALDNSVIVFGGAMHGSNHQCNQLPIAVLGGGGGALQMDQHIVFDRRPLRHLYFTVMNHVYGMNVDDFGIDRTGAPIGVIKELLAT